MCRYLTMLENNPRLHSLDIHMYVYIYIYTYIYIYIYLHFFINWYTFSIGTSVVAIRISLHPRCDRRSDRKTRHNLLRRSLERIKGRMGWFVRWAGIFSLTFPYSIHGTSWYIYLYILPLKKTHMDGSLVWKGHQTKIL